MAAGWIQAAALVGSALIGNQSSKNAASKGSKGQKRAIDEQRRQFDIALGLAQPGIDAGNVARNQLLRLLGLPTVDTTPINTGPQASAPNKFPSGSQRALTAADQAGKIGLGLHDPLLGGALGLFGIGSDKPKRGKLAGTLWERDENGKIISTGKGHWNPGLGLWVDRRGRKKQHQAPPPDATELAQLTGSNPEAATPQEFQDPIDVIRNTPGFQFQTEQGNRALNVDRSAGGNSGGALLKDFARFNQGLASNFYQDYANRLAALAGSGQTASTNAGNQAILTGRNIGQNLENIGLIRGSGVLGQGQNLQNLGGALSQIDFSKFFGNNPTANSGINTSSLGGISSSNFNPFGNLFPEIIN